MIRSELENTIDLLEQNNTALSEKIQKLEKNTKRLKKSNYFKLIMLLATLMVGTFSLAISIWSEIESDRKGLSESGIALSGLSLTLSFIGLFSDIGSICSKNDNRPKADCNTITV